MDLRFVTPRPTATMDVHDDPFPSTGVREIKIELSRFGSCSGSASVGRYTTSRSALQVRGSPAFFQSHERSCFSSGRLRCKPFTVRGRGAWICFSLSSDATHQDADPR